MSEFILIGADPGSSQRRSAGSVSMNCSDTAGFPRQQRDVKRDRVSGGDPSRYDWAAWQVTCQPAATNRH